MCESNEEEPGGLPLPADELPPGLEAYRRTPEFSEVSVPKGLLQEHSTKAGVWGLIRVVEGQLLYRITDHRRVSTERLLGAGDAPGVVEPEILHRVEPKGRVRFFVEFFREP
jgi:tellurite resistance-related uncharacterized protein